MRKNYKFNTPWDSDYWMESNGFHCGFNMVEALKSKNGEDGEFKHGLPDYNWRRSYLVDEYPASPKDWMTSSGRMTSHFVPIQEGQGMWLDFNKNEDQKYHVAIVVSIQGVNAITGMPCKDAQLEQYLDECPKHKKPFGPNRLCEECGFKWPKQNYICTTSTPKGNLWIDGFRAANGAVQQYILTEKTMRGVASNIIGSDRVYAIGISFFLSKNPKPVITQPIATRGGDMSYQLIGGTSSIYGTSGEGWQNRCSDVWNETPPSGGWGSTGENRNITSPGISICEVDETWSKGYEPDDSDGNDELSSSHSSVDSRGTKSSAQYDCAKINVVNTSALGNKKGIVYTDPQFFSPVSDPAQDIDQLVQQGYKRDMRSKAHVITRRGAVPDQITQIRTKNMEIGAGASIDQIVYDDTEPLDFWRDKPEALLCINYCLEDEAIKILQQGKVSKLGHPQGFLQGVPVGN